MKIDELETRLVQMDTQQQFLLQDHQRLQLTLD